VLLIHFLVSYVVGRAASRDDEQFILNRLMLRSLAEDGEFAEVLFRRFAAVWVPKIDECLGAARAAGEAIEGAPVLGGWFIHHLAIMISVSLMPTAPCFATGVPRDQLVEQTVLFALRGLGLREEAIKRHYTPENLARLT
jgi:hypothetical protein